MDKIKQKYWTFGYTSEYYGQNLKKTNGLNLAFTGAIKDDVLDIEEIAFYLLKYLVNNELNLLCEKYKLDKESIERSLREKEENDVVLELQEIIGRKKGALVSRTEELIKQKLQIF